MIIDISQEVLSSKIYPGDPSPVAQRLCSIEQGDSYNLTVFSMCVHNGTHIDAPFHFINDGKTVDQMSIDVFVGACYVIHHRGDIDADAACDMLRRAISAGAGERLLIAGEATVTAEAARVFAQAHMKLIGNESQTVGPENAPMEVHNILLGADVVLLEGIVLTDVSEGKYFLCALPLNLSGCDGSPCRAILITDEV